MPTLAQDQTFLTQYNIYILTQLYNFQIRNTSVILALPKLILSILSALHFFTQQPLGPGGHPLLTSHLCGTKMLPGRKASPVLVTFVNHIVNAMTSTYAAHIHNHAHNCITAHMLNLT